MLVVWALVTAVLMAGMIGVLHSQRLINTPKDTFESIYKVSEFDSSAELLNIVVNEENQDVIIGAVNHIYGFYNERWQEVCTSNEWYLIHNTEGVYMDTGRFPPLFIEHVFFYFGLDSCLNLKVNASTGPHNDIPVCKLKEKNTYSPPCSKTKIPTNNNNKVLVIDYENNVLISCGTLFDGLCEKRNLSDAFFSVSFNSSLQVSNDLESKVVAFIAPGPIFDRIRRKALYLSLSIPFKTFTKSNLILFGSRKLDNLESFRRSVYQSSNMYVRQKWIKQNSVDFKYGFSSGNFIYILSVQKISGKVFGSKISRICQNDAYLSSTYVEIVLICKSKETNYNILQAAYTTKTRGLDTHEDVLYGLFSVGKHLSATPTNQNALCIYPLKYIHEKFTDNIKKCLYGNERKGTKHTGDNVRCVINQVSI